MKKSVKKNIHPADRKLTAKEKRVLAPLYETYIPVRDRKEPETEETRRKAYADIQELFD